jgi:hypothetical protein
MTLFSNDMQEIEEGARAYCAPVEVPARETGTSIDARLVKMKQALDRAEKEFVRRSILSNIAEKSVDLVAHTMIL